MSVEKIIENPYRSSLKDVARSEYSSLEIFCESTIPGYALLNGIYWDRAIAHKHHVRFSDVFNPKICEYLSVEFFKLYLIGTGIFLTSHYFH